jgi:hypothetical protein
MSGSWGLPGSPTCVTRGGGSGGGVSRSDRTPPTETMRWQGAEEAVMKVMTRTG